MKSKSFTRSPKIGAFSRTLGAGVGSAVSGGIKPLPVQEDIFNELQIGVVAEILMVDVPRLSVGTDDEPGDSNAVPIDIYLWRVQMVVKSAPIIPRHEDSGAAPIRAGHDGINETGDVGLTRIDRTGRVFAVGHVGDDPRNLWQGSIPGVDIEIVERHDVSQLVILLHSLKQWERVPIPGCHPPPVYLVRTPFLLVRNRSPALTRRSTSTRSH